MLFKNAPNSLCIIRLSAIGDVAHVISVVQSIQAQWPNTKITWIIGKIEYELVKKLPHVHFVIFDKKHNFQSYLSVDRQLKQQHFDALLMMQPALRASVISLLIKARYKIGFDKARSKDGQTWFSNQQISGNPRVHVVDTFHQFLAVLGLQAQTPQWHLPLEPQALEYAQQVTQQNYVVINPNSSVTRRNWTIEGYATVIDYLIEHTALQVIITGAPSVQEKNFNHAILAQCKDKTAVIDLSGQTNLQQLAAIIQNTQFVIAPDTGPAHIATATNTPVISLFADTNPNRARPYNSKKWCVNEYPKALTYYHKTHEQSVPWGFRIRKDNVMQLISINSVLKAIKQLCTDLNIR